MKTPTCPICSDSNTERFIKRDNVPVHQNLIMASAQASRDIARGVLEMFVCKRCGFVFNAAFDAALLSYGAEYDNTQTCSPSFKRYTQQLVSHLIEQRGVQNARIVEVGCGKGHFIQELVRNPENGNTGWGFDPSYAGPDDEFNGRLQFKRELYSDGCDALLADVVVCRHVIEHVHRPIELLRTIRSALRLSPNARVFFETPSVEWILENVVFWDFFYEHCSLFSNESLRIAFELAGFRVTDIRRIFGHQYLWIEATPGSNECHIPLAQSPIIAMAKSFSQEEERVTHDWRTRLKALAGVAPVAIWGAGAKGVTFANLLDPDCSLVDCVVDLNPQKQGRFIPGTGHPIVAPLALGERSVQTAILMNPNYREENLNLLRTAGLAVTLEE